MESLPPFLLNLDLDVAVIGAAALLAGLSMLWRWEIGRASCKERV